MTDVQSLIGRELDAAVAVTLFDWRWYLKKSAGMVCLYPPEGDEYIRWNYAPEWFDLVGETDGGHKRFSDWDRSGGYRGSTDGYMPCFSTDPTASRKVIDYMLSNGWNCDISMPSEGHHRCRFWELSGNRRDGRSAHTHIEIAIARAALMAVAS